MSSAQANCLRCPLAATRLNVALPRGNPTAQFMFVGEGPGAREDERGLAFVGPSGALLDKALGDLGLDPTTDVFVTNIVRCRPPGNRVPYDFEAEACRPWLLAELQSPWKRVIALGATASGQLVGIGVEHVRIWHPAYVLRNRGEYQQWVTTLRDAVS